MLGNSDSDPGQPSLSSDRQSPPRTAPRRSERRTEASQPGPGSRDSLSVLTITAYPVNIFVSPLTMHGVLLVDVGVVIPPASVPTMLPRFGRRNSSELTNCRESLS